MAGQISRLLLPLWYLLHTSTYLIHWQIHFAIGRNTFSNLDGWGWTDWVYVLAHWPSSWPVLDRDWHWHWQGKIAPNGLTEPCRLHTCKNYKDIYTTMSEKYILQDLRQIWQIQNTKYMYDGLTQIQWRWGGYNGDNDTDFLWLRQSLWLWWLIQLHW